MYRQIRHPKGFTLVEMLIVIAIFGFVLAANSQMFISMLRTHRQQSRITETNIEGLIGLEMLRQDLGKAGYGLPWDAPTASPFNYNEKATDTYSLNDSTTNAAPRGIVSKNDVTAVSGILAHTDYLAVKAANIATNSASGKWTFLLASGATTSWSPDSENLLGSDRIIVITPPTSAASNPRTLIAPNAQFSGVAAFKSAPTTSETRLVYGIDSDTTLRMPFNRADYFVMQPSDMPKRCAAGTGVLYKGVVNQSDGGVTYMPLLDCVADMQVIFRRDLDQDPEGVPEDWTEDISASDASAIRTQVKEVRVFILAQEGQRDPDYRHPVSTIHVGDPGRGRDFDLSALITDWQHYRWKVYSLVVKLENLD